MANFPQHLLNGHARFTARVFASQRDRYTDLVENGQHPATMVIACVDSRVAPETVFDAAAGELFVARNVANIVPAHGTRGDHAAIWSAIEYAVEGLKVANLVVMGHSQCGGIHAALDDSAPLTATDYVGKWLGQVADLTAAVKTDATIAEADRQCTLEHRSIARSLANLRACPDIAAREAAGQLAVHGVWFDIKSGALKVWDEQAEAFVAPAD